MKMRHKSKSHAVIQRGKQLLFRNENEVVMIEKKFSVLFCYLECRFWYPAADENEQVQKMSQMSDCG